ncbi:MAG: S46 family peptidase [Bacteroidetes bacterium]|nr:S46 family peptidase [Bacteroidota bacterium]
MMAKPVNRFLGFITIIFILIAGTSHTHEEGMFPLNYLNEKNLKEAGLKLNASEIFNPDGVALTNALVKVGGCTGSFISDKGLIITNHHCVYGGVAGLSNSDHNYLENGFVAKENSEELPIDMPCRITQSYEDVTDKVLRGIDASATPETRAAAIAANIKQIRTEESSKFPELSIEVSEMFVGKSYTLFRYLLITDVRLVFAPPVTIGQFGGDLDNWEWPRHNGDFGLVRAYVGKNGKPAKYSKDNIPYKPEKHLKINAKGTKEGDFVFIMGYPGRTFRHESAGYMDFQQNYQLPEIQKWYKWCIDKMREISRDNENKYLAFAGNIQSMENVEKNYRGKIQGLRRTDLVNQKYMDEDAMLSFATDKGINANHIPEIRSIWKRKKELAEKRFTYLFLSSQSESFALSREIESAENALENAKDANTKNAVFQKLRDYVKNDFLLIDKEYEKAILRELLQRISKFRNLNTLIGKSSMDKWVNDLEKKEKLLDTNWVSINANTKTAKLADYDGPVVSLVEFLEEDMDAVFKEWNDLDLKLKALMPRYLDLKESFKSGQFIPDANSTLRLTYGYIKRFSPNDAEIHTPYTSLKGVFEKANSAPDYRLPQLMADNLSVKNVPAFFKDPATGEVVVCFLYNLDTTGGNSGSPVLDANGDLIGVNFDRSFTATINDYAWNDKYSRSIGVDIRYVVYIIKYIGKADHILEEIGIEI